MKETLCPKCGHPIKECHCNAVVDIIGKLDEKSHTWVYHKDKNEYDFDIYHGCKTILGINKVS